MMQPAGKRDRRLTLCPRLLAKGELNSDVESWPDGDTVWSSYQPVSDGERFRAGEVGATITARFQILWRGDVDPTWRVRFEGREFDVIGAKEIGRREGLEISAAARAEHQA